MNNSIENLRNTKNVNNSRSIDVETRRSGSSSSNIGRISKKKMFVVVEKIKFVP